MPNLELLDKLVRELKRISLQGIRSGPAPTVGAVRSRRQIRKAPRKCPPRILQSSGINLANLDRARAKELRSQTKELREFIDEFKPAAVARAGKGAGDAKEAAIRSATFADGGHLVLPPFASSIFVADKAVVDTIPGNLAAGPSTAVGYSPTTPRKFG